MLKELSSLMVSGEEIRLTMKRVGDDLQVLVQPALQGDGKDLGEAAAQARALLATPIVVNGAVGEVEHALLTHIETYGGIRRNAADDMKRVLNSMLEGGKKVANEADKATPATTNSDVPAPTDDAPDAPVEQAGSTTPEATDSLF